MAKKVRTANFKDFESYTTNGRFVRIAGDMIESQAWQQLDAFERDLYLHIKNKFRVNQRGESNERNISFTYREGQELMSKARFTKSLDKLIEVGLIDLVGLWRHSKKPTIFGLSARWRDYGTDSFTKQVRSKAKCPYSGGPKRK